MNIIDHDRAAQRFTTAVSGYTAELTYTLADGVMSITHTGVPSEIGGRGVAAQLMQAAVQAAAAHAWSINPVCSYAVRYLAKHPLPIHPAAGARGPHDPAHREATAHQDDGVEPRVRAHQEALLDEALDESFPASDSPAVGGAR
jgi:predicted GNAT family acetyltransferase